jgi:hypothetical protein
MTHYPLPYRITKPPQAFRKAQLDNIALVPASLLSQKGKYQTIASNLPKGGILICETPHKPRIARILLQVAAFFREKGHIVRILPCSVLV